MILVEIHTEILNAENLIIAGVGYVIVFLALLILWFVFNSLPKLIHLQARLRLRKRGLNEIADKKDLSLPGPVVAAISMALHLHFNELHDDEEHIMTIKRVARVYSPWSSKIYSMRWPLK